MQNKEDGKMASTFNKMRSTLLSLPCPRKESRTKTMNFLTGSKVC